MVNHCVCDSLQCRHQLTGETLRIRKPGKEMSGSAQRHRNNGDAAAIDCDRHAIEGRVEQLRADIEDLYLCRVAGFEVAAIDPGIPGVAAASVMAGGAYAFMHSTLQSWATDVAPSARGTMAALFVTGYQLGAAAGVAAVAGLAGGRQYSAIFWIATVVAIPVLVAGTIGRARYSGSVAGGRVDIVD